MLRDMYHAQYEHEEYERRVRALLLERAVLKARAARANAIAHLVGQGFRLAAGLAMTTWRWGRSMVHRVRWTPSLLGKPYSETPTRELR